MAFVPEPVTEFESTSGSWPNSKEEVAFSDIVIFFDVVDAKNAS